MLFNDEEMINICEFDKYGDIKFTEEFLKSTELIGYKAREFASYLITNFEPGNETLLNYFNPEDNKFTGQLNAPVDVVEDRPELWSYLNKPIKGVSSEWHRDILRAKLVSIKIPIRLINEYIKILTTEL